MEEIAYLSRLALLSLFVFGGAIQKGGQPELNSDVSSRSIGLVAVLSLLLAVLPIAICRVRIRVMGVWGGVEGPSLSLPSLKCRIGRGGILQFWYLYVLALICFGVSRVGVLAIRGLLGESMGLITLICAGLGLLVGIGIAKRDGAAREVRGF